MELFVALGFIINMIKSTLTPTQELEFLGFLLNSHIMTITPSHVGVYLQPCLSVGICSGEELPDELLPFPQPGC